MTATFMTRGRQHAEPNYEGECVPIVSDVDCARGSANGPDYVQGPFTVVGANICDLDRDCDLTR